MLTTLANFMRTGLRPAHLNQRMPLWHPDLPVVIFWSQKSGCTTVVKWFLYQIGELQAAEAHSHWVHDYENAVLKMRPGYRDGCYAAIKAGRPVIKFVRDPAARAYSSYLELCNPRVKNSPLWHDLRRQVLDAIVPGHAVDLDYTFSFHDFVDWLEHADLERIDGHVRGQYVPAEDHLLVEALPIERLETHFAALARRFDLKPVEGEMVRIYASGHHHKKTTDLTGAALEQALQLGVPLQRPRHFALPHVSTARLAGTDLGGRLTRIFARDYEAYPFYQLAHSSASHTASAGMRPHAH
jgi:hypothetical protein